MTTQLCLDFGKVTQVPMGKLVGLLPSVFHRSLRATPKWSESPERGLAMAGRVEQPDSRF